MRVSPTPGNMALSHPMSRRLERNTDTWGAASRDLLAQDLRSVDSVPEQHAGL